MPEPTRDFQIYESTNPDRLYKYDLSIYANTTARNAQMVALDERFDGSVGVCCHVDTYNGLNFWYDGFFYYYSEDGDKEWKRI